LEKDEQLLAAMRKLLSLRGRPAHHILPVQFTEAGEVGDAKIIR
jgi:hypothetical protein